MTEKEKADTMHWNLIVALYTIVKDKTDEPIGSVEFIENMLKFAKTIELTTQENFSQRSLDTKFRILYETL